MESRPQTLLSAVHALTVNDAFPSSSTQNLHLFSQSDKGSNAALPQLKNILATASHISVALSSHLSLPLSDPKLVSMMRQHAAIAQELYTTESQLSARVKALRERHGVDYGQEMPSNPSLVQWLIAQIEFLGKFAGMQFFREPEKAGKLGVALTGKILVLDIEFGVIRRKNTIKIELNALKSSHASPLDAPATSASSLPTSDSSLDTFLTEKLREYLEELQKDREGLEALRISELGKDLRGYLQYIMKLDSLAQREIEGGSRWFTEVDDLSSVANQVVPKEAETVSKELGLLQAPLDILLLRGHALPLPYLRTPSICFLVYLPPLSYFTLLRSSSPSDNAQNNFVDIPFTLLRKYVSQVPIPKGLVMANLSLAPSTQPSHFAQTQGRPTFPLIPPEISDDVDFQNLDHILPVDNGPDEWVLDFGPEGVIMAQSRMWEIQVLLGIAPASHAMPMMSFVYGGNWLDLLVQGVNYGPRERYTALHLSPTNAHPPLQFRLTSPLEPGYILHKIRVQSMRDIWAICEIVKEQCWYNSLLNQYKWYPEGQEPPDFFSGMNEPVEEDLDAILNGNMSSRRIPVSLILGATLPALFEPQIPRTYPAFSMVFPSKDSSAPLINASIAFDPSRSTSVKVVVNSVIIPSLEEFVRRGGGLSLAGQIWSKSGMFVQYNGVWNT